MKIKAIVLSLAIFAFVSCDKEETPDPPAELDCSSIKFSETISPLVSTSCGNSNCHGSGSQVGEMTNYDQIKGYVDSGKFQNRVLEVKDMPVGGSLSADQLEQIQCWIDEGAPNN